MGTVKFNVGDKVLFAEEKVLYRVRACDERYVICTRPYNPKRTVQYTIMDLKSGLRNRDNLVFCLGYESDEDCKARLKDLQEGRAELSHRGAVEIRIWAHNISHKKGTP